MSGTGGQDTTKFLLSCIRHSNNGKINFEEVASECGITSKGAAAKRYERLVKSYASTKDENATPGAAESPKKGRAPAKRKSAVASAKEAVKKAKGNAEAAAEAENQEKAVSNGLSKREMKRLDDELDAAEVSEDSYVAGEKVVSGEISETEAKKLDEELDAAEA